MWKALGQADVFAGHERHVTVAERIGKPDCTIPACGINWLTTRQPVVLEHWPVTDAPIVHDGLTTLANWRGYGSIEHNGVHYGQKCHALREFITLPTLTTDPFLLAVAIDPDETRDLTAFAANGWRLADPSEVASTPSRYQCFIQSSRAEFGIAKSGYVASRCGWFSDRSVCYLASGRPVLAQDTGLAEHYPVGEGLLTFDSLDEAVAGVRAINCDYARHCKAAREVAEACFDSDIVLARLLGALGVG